MKRLRISVVVGIVTVLGCIILYLLNVIELREIFLGAVLGAIVSVTVNIPFELSLAEESQRYNVSKFFWEGVLPYWNDISDIFDCVRELNIIDNSLFEDTVDSRLNWETYIPVYNSKKEILIPLIKRFEREVLEKGSEYKNHTFYLSSLMGTIESNTYLGKVRKDFKSCYNVKEVIENINITLFFAYNMVSSTQVIDSEEEKNCKILMTYKNVTEFLCNEFNINIPELENLIMEKNTNKITAHIYLDVVVEELIAHI